MINNPLDMTPFVNTLEAFLGLVGYRLLSHTLHADTGHNACFAQVEYEPIDANALHHGAKGAGLVAYLESILCDAEEMQLTDEPHDAMILSPFFDFLEEYELNTHYRIDDAIEAQDTICLLDLINDGVGRFLPYVEAQYENFTEGATE